MSIAPERYAALRQFVLTHFAARRIDAGPTEPGSIDIGLASADASFRNYWRVTSPAGRWIVMNAPPDKLDVGPWLDVEARLRAAGLHAPAVHAVDRPQGFLLIEDLGTRTYLDELTPATVDALYSDALDALFRMHDRADAKGLPHYDAARLVTEMELLPQWFLTRHLGFVPSCDEWDVIEAAFLFLVKSALEQPQRFLHRDYHSRNLLITTERNPGIIDFQDALQGPVTYDLVSLLRDAYVLWPAERVDAWAESYRRRLADAGIVDADARLFRRWFDLMGLQRHIKILGIFCRLWYRDGKPEYLANLPRVLGYVLDVARQYSEFEGLVRLLERATAGRDLVRAAATVAAT